MGMIGRDEIAVFPGLDELSGAAAEFLTDAAERAIKERGKFVLALAGGSTPRRLYGALAGAPWRQRIDWSRCHFFLSDERVVPLTDANSNYRMAAENLLSKVPIHEPQIHPAPVELGNPKVVAAAYEEEIREFFGPSEDTAPRFDLVLLGMGSDGHTASLFPGKVALAEEQRLVVASGPGVLPPPVDRVTFTFPLLNAANAVAFLVAGADKQAALRSAREGTPLGQVPVVPAARVRPTEGSLRWFVDAEAAGGPS